MKNKIFRYSFFFLLSLLLTQCEIPFDAEIRHKISGVVVDGAGNPVPRAKVSVHEASGWETFVTYTTPQNGVFQGLIAGINNSLEQNYRLEINHEIENEWVTKNYYFSMKDQPNQTLDLSSIKIFPNQNLKQVAVIFQMSFSQFSIKSFRWTGDVARVEGFLNQGFNDYYNLCPTQSQSTITYELININTQQISTFTRTIDVLEDDVQLILEH